MKDNSKEGLPEPVLVSVEDTPLVVKSNPVSALGQLKETIKKRVHKETNEAVETALVFVELNRRKDAVLKGLERHDQLQNENKKFKPDDVRFDNEGKENLGWKKETFEKKRKNEKDLEDLINALELALDKGDYQKLNNILGSNNKDNKEGVKPTIYKVNETENAVR